MHIEPLTPQNQPAALAYLRAAPYRNALPLSNMTQLRARCDVLLAEWRGAILGVASTYHDLPLPNLTFAAGSADIAGALLRALADRNPQLRAAPAYALLPLDRRDQLARFVQVLEARPEYQMAIEPEQLDSTERWPVRRLAAADLPEIDALAQLAGLTTWHADALALGPAYGCFADDRLVAMAATHFVTTDVIEIGHIATHPDYRRRGYASACTSALVQAAIGLAPRVFLMVMADNTPALAAYKRLGFHAVERFYLTRFTLR
jgi:ribosomal protein S18 acetylase RimI-like enzyme